MCDLEKIANNYNLQGELYYGGGLQRILDLLGSTRERKFVKFISRIDNMKADEKWSKLEDFLRAERKEREAYVLNDKVKQFSVFETVLEMRR